MKNLLLSAIFMLFGTFAFANSTPTISSINEFSVNDYEKIENNIKNSLGVDAAHVLKAEVQNIQYIVDGKTYTTQNLNSLTSDTLDAIKECTINVTVHVTINGQVQTFTAPVTFEASWFGCLAAKVGTFILSLWNPSI